MTGGWCSLRSSANTYPYVGFCRWARNHRSPWYDALLRRPTIERPKFRTSSQRGRSASTANPAHGGIHVPALQQLAHKTLVVIPERDVRPRTSTALSERRLLSWQHRHPCGKQRFHIPKETHGHDSLEKWRTTVPKFRSLPMDEIEPICQQTQL